MTTPDIDPVEFWNSMLDRMEEVVEHEQRDKDPDHIWRPERLDPDGGSQGVSKEDRLRSSRPRLPHHFGRWKLGHGEAGSGIGKQEEGTWANWLKCTMFTENIKP